MPESGFIMDVRTCELFFRVCKLYKINDLEKRLKLLGDLAKRGRTKYLRDISETIAGKKVLRIGRKRGIHEN